MLRHASSTEQSAITMCTSFTCTVLTSRAINYTRERRRPMPAMRSRARRLWSAPRSSDLRVHHFVPGIGIIAAAGAAGILSRTDNTGVWLSTPFGTGLAFTLDELALLLNRKNAYWTSERFAFSRPPSPQSRR
ncbi:MAG: hypothetical protein M3076_01035 [Actinomycetota bacterium]|nr:hypothetical protein [Actinomycetota bacterium]